MLTFTKIDFNDALFDGRGTLELDIANDAMVAWDVRPEERMMAPVLAGAADKLCDLFDLLFGTGLFGEAVVS